MGQENSHEEIDPSTPPRTLSARSLSAVAEYIKDGRPKRIVVMTGAGISTSAGIPDFRSPDTGLYANLARLNLPYAEAVFDISYFRQHPEPFYVLAKELYPGQFYPTIAHSFVALLEEEKMLQMLFTQNIDCLERRAGVPGDKIVEAHGSFATQRCIECKTVYPDNLMMKAVEAGEVPHCNVPQCNGLVKPDIVFFGEALPEAFFQNRHIPAMADLVIVMGTSLSVQPFASLPQFASEGVPRVLINKEKVGDLGSRPDDVLVLGDCDEGVRKLADALGWRDKLESMWLEVGGKVKDKEAARLREQRQAMSKDEILEAEIEKITGEIGAVLKVSKDHEERVNRQLEGTSSSEASTSATPADSENVLSGKVMAKEEPRDPSSSAQSTTASELPTKSEARLKEPPSTSLIDEKTPLTTEKVDKEVPAEKPRVDSKAILDVTLPHQRPNAPVAESEGDKDKPHSRI
ncbi:SIR2-domain-containing protein [Stipitochalara longipes BDJ]|nr:SIR2-domain-containing protein [Stipitochalara longipes BDJ]